MDGQVKELLFVGVELVSTLNELGKLENGDGADYSDVATDLKWNLHILQNRLNDLMEAYYD